MTSSMSVSPGPGHTKVARQSIWLNVAGVAAFAAIVYLLATFTQVRLSGAPLMAASVVLALVPALLFLLAFVRADSIEPEPRAQRTGRLDQVSRGIQDRLRAFQPRPSLRTPTPSRRGLGFLAAVQR